jgi:hypothetical protein
MKTAEGYRAVEVVLQSFDHALAGKWPVACQQDQTNRRQRQNRNAYDDRPSPSAEMKSPV